MIFEMTIMIKAISIDGRAMLSAWLKRFESFFSEEENISFCTRRANKTTIPMMANELVIAVAVAVETVEVVTTVDIIISSFDFTN